MSRAVPRDTGGPTDTKFARILRSGKAGAFRVHAAFAAPHAAALALSSKTIPRRTERRESFLAALDEADVANSHMITDALSDAFGRDAARAEILPSGPMKTAALEEWEASLDALWSEFGGGDAARFETIADRMSDHVADAFGHALNENRQTALGIEQYVWITMGDARVRDEHGRLHGQVFDWDDPDPDGHPGQAYNCRCVALPHIELEPDDRPDLSISYYAAIAAAEFNGIRLGVGDFIGGVIDTAIAISGAVDAAREYLRLVEADFLGRLSPDDTAELARQNEAIEDYVRGIPDNLRQFPDVARAFVDYAVTTQVRPGQLDRAYREGRATRAQVEAAFEDRARFRALLLAGAAETLVTRNPLTGPRTVLRGMARLDADAPLEPDRLARDFDRLAEAARRAPHDLDLDTLDVPGIAWGQGIRQQGDPWEDFVETQLPGADRTVPNFPVFDLFDIDTGRAVSAKTLNVHAFTYTTRPSQIYGRLRGYVDDVLGYPRTTTTPA